VAFVGVRSDAIVGGPAAVLLAVMDEVQDVELRSAEELAVHRFNPCGDVRMGVEL